MSTVETALKKLEDKREAISRGDSKVAPGEPIHITEAFAPGDGVAQGDLYFEVLEDIPKGYELQEKPALQLVPGNSVGSKHWLESLEGVEVFYRKGFSLTNLEEVDGPVLRFRQPGKVTHPTHGPVHCPAGMIVALYYQVEFEKDQRQRVID